MSFPCGGTCRPAGTRDSRQALDGRLTLSCLGALHVRKLPILLRVLLLLLLGLAYSVPVSAQAIIDAVKRQDLAAVERLLREDPRAVAVKYLDGATPLHFAALNGNLPIMQVLFRYRADVNARRRDGWTAMHCAATTSQVGAMRLLLDHGANIDARTDDGNAPIHKAAHFDQAESVNFLLSNGVDVDTPNADGNSPLVVAAGYGRRPVGQFLIACGANLGVKNNFGRTALDEANLNHQADFVKMLVDYQQSLEERAARDLARQTSGLNLRTSYAAWTNRAAVTKTVYNEDFHGNIPGPEWTSTPLGNNAGVLRISTTPVGNRRFLGEFGNQAVVLTLADLPEHKEITLSFDLFIIRSMDGNIPGIGPDIWSLGVIDGPTLLQTTFANQRSNVKPNLKIQAYPGEYPGDHNSPWEGALETSTLGYKFKNDDAPSMDSVYRLRYTFVNSGRAILFRFAGNNMQEADDESWGITNVQVAVALTPAVSTTTPPAVHPAPGPRAVVRAAPHHGISVRHAAARSTSRSVQRLKLASAPKSAPTVSRLHTKKTAPKP